MSFGFIIKTVFDLKYEKFTLTNDDFNVVSSDINGQWVRLEEINNMIKCGAISFDNEKLEEYKQNTRMVK